MNSCDKNLQAFINTLEETKSISSGWPEFFFVKFEAKDVIRWPFRKETGAFKSKAACKAQAEKTLKTIYNQAEQRFRQAKDEVLTNYLSHLTEHLGRLDGLLAQCRTAENETVAESIRDLLTAEQISRDITRIFEGSRENYLLPPLSVYLEQIEYTQHSQEDIAQSDAERIFERMFRQYGFNALEAAHKLDQDGRTKLLDFRKEFLRKARLQVIRSVVDPVYKLLPELAADETAAS